MDFIFNLLHSVLGFCMSLDGHELIHLALALGLMWLANRVVEISNTKGMKDLLCEKAVLRKQRKLAAKRAKENKE